MNGTLKFHGAARLTGLLLAIMFAQIAPGQRPILKTPKTPDTDGLRFVRTGGKPSGDLAHPAGGAKERIEVQSTDDHIDYVTKTYVLKHANADEVYFFIANSIQKEGGKIDRFAPGSDVEINGDQVTTKYSGESLIVVTVPEWMIGYLDETIQQMDRLDFSGGKKGNGAIFIHPRHRRPSEIAALLAPSVASGYQSYQFDDSRNVLYIEEIPSFFAWTLHGVNQYDQPANQIDLSVRIFEIDDQDGKDVGLDWYAWKKSLSGGGLDLKWSNAPNGGSYNLNLQNLTAQLSFNPTLATEFLNFIADKGRAKVITDTEITMINGEPGAINAVTAVPYVIRGWLGGKVSDQPNLDSPPATEPDGAIKEFIEGVQLKVLPTIGTDTIQLNVSAKVSSHVGYTPNQNVPIISTSDVASIVVLESGKAAVLGGLKRKRTVNERQGIPGLKDTPWVKYLFSHEVSRERNSQIIVTLRPTRVNPLIAAQPENKEALTPHPTTGVANGKPQLEPPSGPDELGAK